MGRALRWIASRRWLIGALVLFVVHAAAYAFFFVDDEGITLVYAKNLLAGHGLTYALSEGPTEGYSNFLHVLVMTGVLRLVRAASLPDIAAFVAGGLISLACGAAVIVLVWRIGGRAGWSTLPRTAAVLLLALSGPLAVWSNSSLETVPFALAFTALVSSCVPRVRPRAATFLAMLVLLLRIDGILFVLAWLAARWLTGDAETRRAVLYRIVPVTLIAATVYAGARAVYFHEWLPLPLQTKVAHKLSMTAATIVRTQRGHYLVSFAKEAGVPLLLGLLALPLIAVRRRASAWTWSIAIAAGALIGYVALVGDWMFGFRFFVPLLPLLALLCGAALAAMESARGTVVRALAAFALVWAVVDAVRFAGAYQRTQHKPLFWTAPSLDAAQRFGEYYEAYRALEPLITPGMRIAYHEAGFVPFMLDVENIDMLGLTSRFIGAMPAEDAIYTDVGRYYPLTPEPAHHAVHAYLVYREPALIVARRSWMRTANGGAVPSAILRGYYVLARETRTFVIYRRSGRPINPARVQATGFLENVAHPAYAERLAVNAARVAPEEAAAQLPSLWQGGSHPITIDPEWALHIDPAGDPPVYEVYIAGRAPSADLIAEVRLVGETRDVAHPVRQTVRAGEPLRIEQRWASPHPADTIDIRLTSVTGEPVQLRLQAVRVMAQTAELREHVRRHGIR